MKSLLSIIRISWGRISARGKLTLTAYSVSLISTSLLDGIALFIVAELTAKNAASYDSFGTDGSFNLAVVLIFLLVFRSALATGITWVGSKVFAKQEVIVGQENFSDYLVRPWAFRSKEKIADIFSFVDIGPHAMTQQLLLVVATLIAEVFSCLVIVSVLFRLDPLTAIATVVFFVSTALIQHRYISLIAKRNAEATVVNQQKLYNLLAEVFQLGKVLQIMPSLTLEKKVHELRSNLALARSKSIFLESLPRYMMETVLVVGSVLIMSLTALIKGGDYAIGIIAVFGIAGFRLLPSINRVQGLIVGLLSREPLAKLGLDLSCDDHTETDNSDLALPSLSSDILYELDGVCFKYPGSTENVLDNVSLIFERGKHYAIVGPSGSGKSTLLDIMMGLISPTSGRIQSSFSLKDVKTFVPQENVLHQANLYENVAIEWDSVGVSSDQAKRALIQSSFDNIENDDLFDSLGNLVPFSSGMRQRIGIARAIYRNPTVIFLDEPTSALDSETEHEIANLIDSLRGSVTVFTVAHRISTIKNADQIIYFNRGTVIGLGTYSQLRESLPDFENQVQLSSLGDTN